MPKQARETRESGERAVWKFPVVRRDVFELNLPAGAQVLTVAMQFGAPQLWALVDPAAPIQPRRFALVGTGHPAPVDGRYVGTFLEHDGMFVWHLFEKADD